MVTTAETDAVLGDTTAGTSTRHAMGSIPTFSLAERDSRWARLRSIMEREGLDALVAVPNSGHWDQFQADVRYLTQIGGNSTEAAVVFPREGEVTAILRGENDIAWWGVQQDWITDLRPSRRFYSLPISERLNELGLAGKRIGVSGLGGSVRAPEGVVVWGLFDRLQQALPTTTFVDATQVMQEARSVKSAEEIAFIHQAAQLSEQSVARMMQLAKPGVPERVLYGAMLDTMITGGGEISTMILWGAGQRPPWPHRMLTDRVLCAGDIINNEVEAKWGGYIAQVVAPCSLGPIDVMSRRTFELSVQIFHDLRDFMKPGVRFDDIQKRYEQQVVDAGFEGGAALMHGRGLGEDRPLMWGHRPVEDQSAVLEQGMVFILKPAVFPPGTRDITIEEGETVEYAVRAGDTVVITAQGAERLGTRPLDLVEL